MSDTENKVNKSSKKVKNIRTYSIQLIQFEDGDTVTIRKNENFSVLELIGQLAKVQSDLMKLLEPLEGEVIRQSNGVPLVH